jgi:hypothetical protein
MNNNIIELPKKCNELAAFAWTIKAVSKDKTRYLITLLHVEKATDKTGGTLLCATDGRRLHVARIANEIADPGDYKIIKSTQTQFIATKDDTNATFPNVMQVIPEHKLEDAQKIVLPYIVSGGEFDGQRIFDIAIKFHALKQGKFNLNFLADAVAGLDSIFAWQRDNVDPVLIKDQPGDEWTRLAVIMPCRVG